MASASVRAESAGGNRARGRISRRIGDDSMRYKAGNNFVYVAAQP
jgi:hypothetical protein